MNKGYRSLKLSFNRKMVIASATVTKQKSNPIHSFTEVDITKPRKLIRDHFAKTGEKLSLTAYIVICLAHVIRQYPECNSYIKGRRLILLEDITISVLVEREIEEEKVPEPAIIKSTQTKTFREIQNEIRGVNKQTDKKLGGLSGQTWVNKIPGFLLKNFVNLANSNIKMAKLYGKIGVTSVGMFSREPVWFIPHGTATVLATVGSIINKVIEIDGEFVTREHLCLTVSFDHNIIDGAPAARFMNQFIEILKSGELLKP